MKINSIGIQSYQQLPKREDTADRAVRLASRKRPVTIEPRNPRRRVDGRGARPNPAITPKR